MSETPSRNDSQSNMTGEGESMEQKDDLQEAHKKTSNDAMLSSAQLGTGLQRQVLFVFAVGGG